MAPQRLIIDVCPSAPRGPGLPLQFLQRCLIHTHKHNRRHKVCIHVYAHFSMHRISTFRHKQRSPDPNKRGALMLPAVCLQPSLRCADTDIDCWITTPLPESIKSLHRIDLAGKESGSGDRRGGEQQDSEIHRWIFDSPWPTLSVILFCVLRNRREKLTRQETEQTVLSIAD